MEKLSFVVSAEESGLQVKKLIRSKYHLSARMMTKIKYGDLISVNGKREPGYFVVSEGDSVIVVTTGVRILDIADILVA